MHFTLCIFILYNPVFYIKTQAVSISTEPLKIINKIDPNHDILVNVPPNKRHNLTKKFPPLVTLPCDSENFASQIQSDWTQYARHVQACPPIPPLYVRPECDSFYYRHFQWTPEFWNRLEHSPTAKQFSFEMIYLEIIDKALYVIRNINESSLPHNMYLYDSSDTILLISKVISYFYELYQFVRFKLNISDNLPSNMQRKPCFVALDRLPNIKLPLHTFGTTHISNPEQCNEERLVRFRQTAPSVFLVEFPQGQIENRVPTLRNYEIYKKATGHPDVLDFQWTSPSSKAFFLQIEVGPRLTNNPKLWWIYRQSPSVLGYHDNFFAPESLRTSQTVYSYARGQYHYYAEGLYVKLPDVQYLIQNVTENNYTLQRWPLPTQTENRPLNLNTICAPHIGSFERALTKAMTLLSNTPPFANIDFCQRFASDHSSLNSLRNIYHAQAMTENPHFQSTFFSYHDNQTTFKAHDTSFQQAFNHEFSIFKSLWQNMQPKILQLHQKLYHFHYFHRRSSCYYAERRLYANDLKSLASAWSHAVHARDKATQNLNEVHHLINYFSVTLRSIQQRFSKLYLLKLHGTVLHILQTDSSLRPGILYTHTYMNGQIHSTPYKINRHFTSNDFNDALLPENERRTTHVNGTIEPPRTARPSISLQTPQKASSPKPDNMAITSTNVPRLFDLTTLSVKLSSNSKSYIQNKNVLFKQKILNFFGSPSNFFHTLNMNFPTHGYTFASLIPAISTKSSLTQSPAPHFRGPPTNKISILYPSRAKNSATPFSASYTILQILATNYFLTRPS